MCIHYLAEDNAPSTKLKGAPLFCAVLFDLYLKSYTYLKATYNEFIMLIRCKIFSKS